VNGQLVLERHFNIIVNPNSWEESLTVDITAVVRIDRPNTIAVQVEDRDGDGGIWKPCAVVAE